jgi:hypothetical protein
MDLQKQRTRTPRPSWWTTLESAAQDVRVRGDRQWALVRRLARLGHGKNRGRSVMRGRRKLAIELGLDIRTRPADAPLPPGQGNHDPDGRNTRRRLERLEQLQLIMVVMPACVRAGQVVRARGGRKPGCSSEVLIGRSIRIYPGPAVYPKVLMRKQIELDDLGDAGLIPWTRLSTPREQLTPGQVLELEQLAQQGLRRRGPPPP